METAIDSPMEEANNTRDILERALKLLPKEVLDDRP